MTFRAICTDIDGTLLDSRRELSPRTIAAIRKIKDRVPIILASSRMPSAMRHLQAELDILDHPMICYNGGYVLSFSNGTEAVVTDSVSISAIITESIMDVIGRNVHTSLYQNDNWYAPGHDEWTEREARITKVSPRIVEDLRTVLHDWKDARTGAHKIMCMGPAEEIDRIQQTLDQNFTEHVHAYRSKSTYLEIAPRAISKASALKQVLQQFYGMEIGHAVAFGDNYNDIEMLHQAGWGVAVENAREEAKAVANEITTRNTEDGVAHVIEKFFHVA